MIKKLKLGLLIAVLSLFGVSFTYAANITYSTYLDILLPTTGYKLTIYPNSDATSLVVNDSSIDVVVPTSSTFTIASHNNIAVVAAGGTDASSNSCTGVTNTLTIPGDSAITYTLTPGSGVCTTGGGGGSYIPPVTTTTTPAVPATPATPGNVIVGCGNRTTGFSTASGVSCVGNTATTPATPATPATPSVSTSSYNLGTKTLKSGSRGDAVMELQRFLNDKLNLGLVVDGKLGPKTIAVIKQWQKDNGLVADGLVGVKTKAKMNAQAN